MIMMLGYIFAGILIWFAAYVVYHLIKGLVLGIDLMRWKMNGITWKKIREAEGYKLKLVKMFYECWGECIGYNGSTTFSRNGRKWSGYGTGRK